MIDDEVTYTEQIASDAVAHAAALRPCSSISDVSPWWRQRLKRFVLDDVGLLANNKVPEAHQPFEAEVDAIMEALADADAMPARLLQAAETARDAAHQLVAYGDTFGFSYLREHDLSDDPVLQRVQSRLGVTVASLRK